MDVLKKKGTFMQKQQHRPGRKCSELIVMADFYMGSKGRFKYKILELYARISSL